MKGLYTTKQASARLGISEQQLRTLAQTMGLGVLVTNRLRIFNEADLEKLRQHDTQRDPTPTLPTTEHNTFRWERYRRGRCLQCGSSRLVPTAATTTMLQGRQCGECGYVNEQNPPPFIEPGDPGSHDQASDYD